MPINHDSVGAVGPLVTRTWTSKDALLYAVGVGAGQDDPASELAFTTENSRGVDQHVLPTFAVIVGSGGVPALGSFDLAALVHGGQSVTLHEPLPPEGTLEATAEIVGIFEKGKAAVVEIETRSTLVATGAPLCTTRSSLFIRGEGGWVGDRGRASNGHEPPDRAPDANVTYHVPVDQALLYRLSGDRNPLHSDPTFAQRAGFDRPILHGLCTYGYTGRAVLHELCGGDPARFRSMGARFSRPVLPGDTLTVSIWANGGEATFQTTNQDGAPVLTGGHATYEG
ncbi:MAG: MaoC/PaaZ C-terminal domain-containing protein [Acidimicrobiales bacterium]